MGKTLEEAVGCWTTSSNGLAYQLKGIADSVRRIKLYTQKGDKRNVAVELHTLARRLSSMNEIAAHAQHRMVEVERDHEVASKVDKKATVQVLDDRIVKLLEERGPMRLMEIAAVLEIDRARVGSRVYAMQRTRVGMQRRLYWEAVR